MTVEQAGTGEERKEGQYGEQDDGQHARSQPGAGEGTADRDERENVHQGSQLGPAVAGPLRSLGRRRFTACRCWVEVDDIVKLHRDGPGGAA